MTRVRALCMKVSDLCSRVTVRYIRAAGLDAPRLTGLLCVKAVTIVIVATVASRSVVAKEPRSVGVQTVHVLHEPEGQPTFDVLFFHGLQLGSYKEAWEHTWKNKQGVLWPAEWLAKLDYKTARVMSICYDSQAIRGGESLDQIAKNLVSEVCFLSKVGQDRPVVLVGHSLGGLVLKKLAMEAHKQARLQGSLLNPCCKAFCNNLAGTFFFATPHGGAALGSLANRVSGAVGQKGPVLDYLTVFSKQGAELNRDFMLAFPTLSFMALVETKNIYNLGWLLRGVQVVKEGSAMQGMHTYFEVDEDHISICKPPNTDAKTYRLFKEYLAIALDRFQTDKKLDQQAQERVLDQSLAAKFQLAQVEIDFTNKFTTDVDPCMKWLRGKKAKLEKQLGECWAEGLYSPVVSEDEIEQVEQRRKTTRDFWRNIQTMANKGLLDDTFFTGNWVRRGVDYRLLWEPVEIVNFYRLSLQNSNGHYIDGIVSEFDDNHRRPGRFILLQKQEQSVFGEKPTYNMESSLGLARLLKEKVGNRSWHEYTQQSDEPELTSEQGQQHVEL